MHCRCPRCDAPYSAHDVQCSSCGYIWLVPCSSCGKPNIPTARFCGRCGTSTSRSSCFWNEIRRIFSKPFGFNARQLGTGFAFGSLLAFFAFGSQGMTSPQHRQITPSEAKTGVSSPGHGNSNPAWDNLSGLRNWRGKAGAASEDATLKDLLQVGRKLLDAFTPDPHDCEIPDSAREVEIVRYLQDLRSGLAAEDGKPLKRSDVALFLYRIASSILNVSIKSVPEANYSDIPRHHYMTVPIRTLESLDMRISRSETVFGSNDTITIESLGKIAADFLAKGELILQAADEKLKNQKLSKQKTLKNELAATAPTKGNVRCKCGTSHD